MNPLKFFKNTIINFNQHNRDLWVASKAKGIPRFSKVLDVGAGFGRYRELFKHCDYKTQDFCQYNGPEWRYCDINYISDITCIPVDDNSFDVILCTEVLEHVPEPIKALKEFSRILKDGGRLFITAPLGCGIHQSPFIFYGGFTPFWYQRFLPEFGFKIVEIIPNGGFFKHYGQETVRIINYFFPDERRKFYKTLLFPAEVMFRIFLQIFIPTVCHWLDKIYPDERFTVGFFVEAIKVLKNEK